MWEASAAILQLPHYGTRILRIPRLLLDSFSWGLSLFRKEVLVTWTLDAIQFLRCDTRSVTKSKQARGFKKAVKDAPLNRLISRGLLLVAHGLVVDLSLVTVGCRNLLRTVAEICHYDGSQLLQRIRGDAIPNPKKTRR